MLHNWNDVEKPASGKLLVSEPFLHDINFKRSVVLICDHSDSTGTFGLILNRKLDVTLQEAMDIPVLDPVPLYLGGPVHTDTLHFLHKPNRAFKDSLFLTPDICWGTNLEVAVALMEDGVFNPNDFRFYLGYAGWGNQQLKSEIEEKSWWVVTAKGPDVFAADEHLVWKSAITRKGGSFALMANYPESPILN